MVKLSARCMRNREKFLHKTLSISSACLILMLTRRELTEGSIRHRSRSVRQIKMGFMVDILEDLHDNTGKFPTDTRPPVCCVSPLTRRGSSEERESHEAWFGYSPNRVSMCSPTPVTSEQEGPTMDANNTHDTAFSIPHDSQKNRAKRRVFP